MVELSVLFFNYIKLFGGEIRGFGHLLVEAYSHRGKLGKKNM